VNDIPLCCCSFSSRESALTLSLMSDLRVIMVPSISRFPEIMTAQDVSDRAFALQLQRVLLANPALQNSIGVLLF
jgi:hypothetical protein